MPSLSLSLCVSVIGICICEFMYLYLCVGCSISLIKQLKFLIWHFFVGESK